MRLGCVVSRTVFPFFVGAESLMGELCLVVVVVLEVRVEVAWG